MKNLNISAFIWLLVGLSITIWLLILLITGTPIEFSVNSFGKLPTVVTADTILFGLFARYFWKSKIFQSWLVPFPDLNGTWHGTIESTWVNPETKQRLPPIKAAIAIKQSFLGLSCTMFTKEMISKSCNASFKIDGDNHEKKLIYTYVSTPDATVRQRSAVHYGTAKFDIIQKPSKHLEGDYWTDRKTTGSMKFEFKQLDLIEKFPSELI